MRWCYRQEADVGPPSCALCIQSYSKEGPQWSFFVVHRGLGMAAILCPHLLETSPGKWLPKRQTYLSIVAMG